MTFVLAWLVMIAGQAQQQGTAVDGPGASFQTSKSLPAIEKCLTKRLSGLGVVTAMSLEGTKTLLLTVEGERPMLIDIAPPQVTVTTKFAFGSRKHVEACV